MPDRRLGGDSRTKKHAKGDWHFTTADARVKLKRLCFRDMSGVVGASALDGVSDQPFFQGLDVGLYARQVRVERGGTLKGRQCCFIIA